MNQENKSYKLTCLFPPLIKKEKLESIIQKIKEEITANNGFFSEIKESFSDLIKRKLAYPIKKNQEAVYWDLNFNLPASTVDKLGQKLNSEKDIIRYIINIKQEKKFKPVKKSVKSELFDLKMIDKIEPLLEKESLNKQIAGAPDKEKEIIQKEEPASSVKKEKTKIEDLDKKLEEILNE